MNATIVNGITYTFEELTKYKNLKVLAELERLNTEEYKRFCNWRKEEYLKNRNKDLHLLKNCLVSYWNNCEDIEFMKDDIEDLLTSVLPHGSGIDCKWNYDFLKNGKIKCSNSWHKMNELGFYCGYIDFWFTIELNETNIKLSNVKLSGKNYNGVREYLNDLFGEFENDLNNN